MGEEEKEVNQPQKDGNGFGIAGFVLGLLSILLFWIWFLGGVIAILGLVFSIIQLRKKKTGLAIAGLVLSIIGILLPLILVVAVTIIWALIIPGIDDQLSQSTNCFDAVSQMAIVDDGTTCVTENGELNLKIRRGFKDFDLSKISVLISSQGNSQKKDLSSNLPSPGSEATFKITDIGYPTIDKIQIAPVIATSEGEKACDISGTLQPVSC